MTYLRPTNGFDRLTDSKLRERTAYIITRLTANSAFPVLDPTLADMTTLLNDFSEAATAALTRDSQKVLERDQKRELLIDHLHLLQACVVFHAKGNRVVAESSGFGFAKEPQPAAPIQKPQNLVVMNSNQSGQMQTSVDRVAGARAFMHQYTTDAALSEGSWQSQTCTQRKCTIEGLVPGTLYFWRVAAVGAKGQIMYSDVVSRTAA